MRGFAAPWDCRGRYISARKTTLRSRAEPAEIHIGDAVLDTRADDGLRKTRRRVSLPRRCAGCASDRAFRARVVYPVENRISDQRRCLHRLGCINKIRRGDRRRAGAEKHVAAVAGALRGLLPHQLKEQIFVVKSDCCARVPNYLAIGVCRGAECNRCSAALGLDLGGGRAVGVDGTIDFHPDATNASRCAGPQVPVEGPSAVGEGAVERPSDKTIACRCGTTAGAGSRSIDGADRIE